MDIIRICMKIQIYYLLGEKQLIHFARVLAMDVDVIILDEVTSNLTYETEKLVSNAIQEVTKGKIAIIIAHRLTTIQNCDRVIKI